MEREIREMHILQLENLQYQIRITIKLKTFKRECTYMYAGDRV